MRDIFCTRCARTYGDNGEYYYQCRECGGILQCRYEDADLAAVPKNLFLNTAAGGIDRYRALLPLNKGFPWESLGEGGTPLVRGPWAEEAFGTRRVWYKNEGCNPTGSFKDRPVSVAVAKARECGAEALITSSSGNGGAALAAYAARAGIPAWVAVPEKTPRQKLQQIASHGCSIVVVRGDVGDAFRLCRELADQLGWVNVTSTFLSPFPTEGDKTVAYELVDQLEGVVPDWVLVPVGAGPLLAGIFLGYREMQRLGLVTRTPRMVAVQAEGCAPIVRAYEEGAGEVRAWSAPNTLAGAIADPLTGYAQDGTHTLAICRETGGLAVAVSDQEIVSAARALARSDGILAEPSGAVAVAGILRLKAQRLLGAGDSVVAVLTGSGLKAVDILSAGYPEPTVIEPQVEAFREAAGV